MFMFESQLVQMPGPRDIILYWPGPRAFSVVQKPRGWARILVQKPRGARGGGMVTGQIDTCIKETRLKNCCIPGAFVVVVELYKNKALVCEHAFHSLTVMVHKPLLKYGHDKTNI